MKIKSFAGLCLLGVGLLVAASMPVRLNAQVLNIGDEALIEKIRQSDKSYKVVYIFCNYCEVSQVRYPAVVKAARDAKDADVFFICAQDSLEVAQYADTCQVKSAMYLINQNRKRKMVSFYNPIKAACKYLKKGLGVNSDRMGASDFCVLDRDNKVIAQTNWEMKNDEYFKLLERSLKGTN